MKEESKGKMYSFWVVWPHDKNEKPKPSEDVSAPAAPDSDNEADRPKDLKQIVQQKKLNIKEQHKRAEEEIERHQQNDNNLSMSVKVAAVAVGGVVVGALTAGIGLVPYITVVGITAVAGGGAVALQYRKPTDSRLILSCETFEEATSWKLWIEKQVEELERECQPMLPASVNPEIIAGIVGMNVSTGDWRKVGHLEGMRILELYSHSSPRTRTRKSQIVVTSTPTNVFLALMETSNRYWPQDGTIKINQVIDDHADILDVTIACGKDKKHIRSFFLSRFWKLDDDGTFFIIYNSVASTKENASEHSNKVTDKNLQIDAVITISPRPDHNEFDDDLREALVSGSIQLSSENRKLNTKEIDSFMDDFLYQLVELRVGLTMRKFANDKSRVSRFSHNSAHSSVDARPKQVRSMSAGFSGGSSSTTGTSGTGNALLMQSPSNTKTGMSKLFRMKSSNAAEINDGSKSKGSQMSIISPNLTSGEPQSHHLAADTSVSGGGQQTRFRSSRRRGSQVNAEASTLRKQIAVKEYELQRCEQVEKRKAENSIVVNSHSIDSQSLDSQRKDILKLKSSYFELTGNRYGDSLHDKRRRVRAVQSESPPPVSRTKSSFGFGSKLFGKDSNTTTAKGENMHESGLDMDGDVLSRARNYSISESADFDDTTSTNITGDCLLPVPSHWKFDESKKELRKNEEFRYKFFIILTFSACFSLSLSLGQLINSYY